MVERCLRAIAQVYSDKSVSVDTSVHNPARIWKLYGTWARKGDSTADRPHRLAKILDAPGTLAAVPRELLDALASQAPVKGVTPARRAADGNGDSFTWLDGFLARNAGTLPPMTGPEPYQGGRRWSFPVCPYNPAHVSGSAFLIQRADGVIQAGCHHNGCAKENWHTLRAMIEPHTPRPDKGNGAAAVDGEGGDSAGRRQLRMTMASEIKPLKVDYVWTGYLARGVLTVSQGLPGFGKTCTASDLAARLTRGDVVPDGTPMSGPADVIFLSGEESAPHIIVPRLIAQGADLARVCIPSIMRDGLEETLWVGRNLDFLSAIADKLRNLQAVILDPYSGLLRPDLNPNSNEDVRRESTPILRWAAERNVAVLGLNHLAKGGSGHSVLRGLGAGALNQVARVVWQIGGDPDNADNRVLASVKSNLCQKPKSLSFSVGEGGAVSWGGAFCGDGGFNVG